MLIHLPKPSIECSKCGSKDVVRPSRVIPEWPANSPFPQPTELSAGDVELRCNGCGHTRIHQRREWHTTTVGQTTSIVWPPVKETF